MILLLPTTLCLKTNCDIYTAYCCRIYFVVKLSDQSMDDHRTAQDVKVHKGGDVGTSGVENGRDHDSILVTDDTEADKENTVPP
eukprot:scaffold114206_cov73-Attheya_sp.AAC.4